MNFDKIGIYDENFIILDTETTGLRRTDEVIELGIISSDGEVLYEGLFNPDFDIDSIIMKITGIRNGDLYDAPYFEDEWDEIKSIIRGKTIIGYNVLFDIRMLEQTMSKYNIMDDLKNIYDSAIDARKIVMNLCNFDSYKQEDVAKSLGVYNHQAHRATNDCLILLDILKKLNKISNLELK